MAALSAADYSGLIEGLMPGGPAWQNDAVRATWSAELARVDARIWQLVEEVDPRTTSELLTDWERVLGLPDECMAQLALSRDDRRVVAWQRLTEIGGQSIAYFVELARQLGDAGATVEEFRPMTCRDTCNDAVHGEADRFVWRVALGRPAGNVRRMNCNGVCTDPLDMYVPSLAECPIRERRPAHTTVLFSYVVLLGDEANRLLTDQGGNYLLGALP